jgi:hypothetical protein
LAIRPRFYQHPRHRIGSATLFRKRLGVAALETLLETQRRKLVNLAPPPPPPLPMD